MTPSAAIGIDVGGTLIKSTVLTPTGVVLDELSSPTPAGIADSIGPVVAQLVHDLVLRSTACADESTIGAVGVVVPGIVDQVRGVGRYSANLSWRDLDLHGVIAPQLTLPLAVGHDVRAGLMAECRFGAAVGANNVLFVPIGTGIASAALCDGRLLTDPYSGEIGHVVVQPDGPVCGCGSRGCLETLASARAIGRLFEAGLSEAGIAVPPGSASAVEVSRLVEAVSPIDSAPVTVLNQPDASRVAMEVWHQAVQALAAVIAPIAAALGAERLLIGGGLVRSGETLLTPLRAAIASRLGKGGLTVEVRAATLGDRAGSLGAGALALDLIDR